MASYFLKLRGIVSSYVQDVIFLTINSPDGADASLHKLYLEPYMIYTSVYLHFFTTSIGSDILTLKISQGELLVYMTKPC